MHLSQITRFLTTPSLAAKVKKSKSDHIIVKCVSVVTGYYISRIRPRLDHDKLEFMCWDPLVQREVLFKESKKIRSVPSHPMGKSVELYSTNINRQNREDFWYDLKYPESKRKILFPRRQQHVERPK